MTSYVTSEQYVHMVISACVLRSNMDFTVFHCVLIGILILSLCHFFIWSILAITIICLSMKYISMLFEYPQLITKWFRPLIYQWSEAWNSMKWHFVVIMSFLYTCCVICVAWIQSHFSDTFQSRLWQPGLPDQIWLLHSVDNKWFCAFPSISFI